MDRISKARDGGAAFPITTIDGFLQGGMSLRDWFAGHTLVIMMARHGITSPDVVARASYSIADAMIAARQEGESDDQS